MRLKSNKGNKHLYRRRNGLTRTNNSKSNLENITLILIATYFLSSLVIFQMFSKLDLSLLELFQLFCLFLGLSFVIPIKIYRKILPLSYYEYILFNALSFSPVFICLTFILNNSFKGESYIETYAIINTEVTSSKTIYTLENNVYDDDEYLRSIEKNEDIEIRGNENLAIYFSDGLFGIRVIEKRKVY